MSKRYSGKAVITVEYMPYHIRGSDYQASIAIGYDTIYDRTINAAHAGVRGKNPESADAYDAVAKFALADASQTPRGAVLANLGRRDGSGFVVSRKPPTMRKSARKNPLVPAKRYPVIGGKRLQPRDVEHIKDTARMIEPYDDDGTGEEEIIATSVGYVTVSREETRAEGDVAVVVVDGRQHRFPL